MSKFSPSVGVFYSRDLNTVAYQTLTIPQNLKSLTLSWRQSSYNGQDQAAHGLEFLDEETNKILGTFSQSISAVKETTISHWRETDYREISCNIPIDAKYVNIVLVGNRIAGTDSNWYTSHITLTGITGKRLPIM